MIRLLILWFGSTLMSICGNIVALGHILFGVDERAWRVIISNDRALNAALGGSENETLSSRASRARSEGRLWGCVLCNWVLDKIQPNHCKSSEGT